MSGEQIEIHSHDCDCEWCWLGVASPALSPELQSISDRIGDRIRAAFSGLGKIRARLRTPTKAPDHG